VAALPPSLGVTDVGPLLDRLTEATDDGRCSWSTWPPSRLRPPAWCTCSAPRWSCRRWRRSTASCHPSAPPLWQRSARSPPTPSRSLPGRSPPAPVCTVGLGVHLNDTPVRPVASHRTARPHSARSCSAASDHLASSEPAALRDLPTAVAATPVVPVRPFAARSSPAPNRCAHPALDSSGRRVRALRCWPTPRSTQSDWGVVRRCQGRPRPRRGT